MLLNATKINRVHIQSCPFVHFCIVVILIWEGLFRASLTTHWGVTDSWLLALCKELAVTAKVSPVCTVQRGSLQPRGQWPLGMWLL